MTEWMNEAQAAEYVGLTKNTLRQYRHSGRGPTYFRIGGVKFRKRELDEWIEQHRATGKGSEQKG